MEPILALIDVGDLTLTGGKETLQQQLFNAVKAKIVGGLWPLQGRLPSSRKLSIELGISRNTVNGAYEQLVAEGYVESKPGSGFYVSLELPGNFLPEMDTDCPIVQPLVSVSRNTSFDRGVPELKQFPMKTWHRLIQRHALRVSLLGSQDIQGCMALRLALSEYLSASRSVSCSAENIIITAGAQQALMIATMSVLSSHDTILMEQPGYTQMAKIIELNHYQLEPLQVKESIGFDLQDVFKSHAHALYITPSNQYPMGTTLDTEARLQLVKWAQKRQSWIIEDDYDSEFQFAHRPYSCLQGLAAQIGLSKHVMYTGSMSKVMFNGLRLGYLVVPPFHVQRCLEIKDALSGDSPSHTQAALADFISEGHLLRHIRKMRRLYKLKYQILIDSFELHLGKDVTVISQAAGLHVTVKWEGGISEQEWVERAASYHINIQSLSYYEHSRAVNRSWQAVVLGFGNMPLEEIRPNIELLARLFKS
ncbi:PLP-dependent aminotransferase family protein [Vibrio aquimaris]|uniref:HTH-type transcriptional regulatory protein GabR n=1 Tax=Vibrio aquimaris TaxID=2587862 RepID=A0A5P9CR25_9VIBR|nr:PLP-dependent aminotransferase family protein [Vibrio aquimaris]QFT28664.1 HTH-type transcriptional regulatory protein GabR [Vibrio aquimaris]